MDQKTITTAMRIRQLRLKKLKVQAEVAKALGISVPAYSKIENGIIQVNIPRLFQIAGYFGVSAQSLVCDEAIQESLVLDNERLNQRLAASQAYTVELQEKLIASLELLDALKLKYRQSGRVISLLD
jgi:transcriptional regulator with XRE-family HTH domain